MIEHRKRYRNSDFISFAKSQEGICCICWARKTAMVAAEELHHWGDKGMGQKCDDYDIARVCRACHRKVQGKRRSKLILRGEIEIIEAMERDAIDLLKEYVESRRRK